MKEFNVYIDESCHLENDKQPVMLVGCVKVQASEKIRLGQLFNEIRKSYKSPTELKWNTLSQSRLRLYTALIDAFFMETGLSFRCVLIKNKSNLDHEAFNQGDHDQFYYKVVYQLLNTPWMMPSQSGDGDLNIYKVFLDIKDTRGRERLTKLKDVFDTKHEGFSQFKSFQHLHSHDSFWIQLTDFLMGAVSYKARNADVKPAASLVKKAVVDYLEKESGYSLNQGTPPWESKFNIFDFQIKAKLKRSSDA